MDTIIWLDLSRPQVMAPLVWRVRSAASFTREEPWNRNRQLLAAPLPARRLRDGRAAVRRRPMRPAEAYPYRVDTHELERCVLGSSPRDT